MRYLLALCLLSTFAFTQTQHDRVNLKGMTISPTAGLTAAKIVPPDNTTSLAVNGRNSTDTATAWSIANNGNAAFATATLAAATVTGALTASSGITAGGASMFKTGTSANTDITGELTFGAVATQSYTWQNTYASHPECVVTPQFDLGATPPRYWVTYTSTTSFTINFSGSVTGTVGYICIGRN
jgi:hypothetical protein